MVSTLIVCWWGILGKKYWIRGVLNWVNYPECSYMGDRRNKPPVTRGLFLWSPQVYSSGHRRFIPLVTGFLKVSSQELRSPGVYSFGYQRFILAVAQVGTCQLPHHCFLVYTRSDLQSSNMLQFDDTLVCTGHTAAHNSGYCHLHSNLTNMPLLELHIMPHLDSKSHTQHL